MPDHRARPCQTVPACLFAATLFLVGCGSGSGVQAPLAALDYSAVEVRLPPPRVVPVLELPEVTPLSARAVRRLSLRRAFFSGHFAAIDEAINIDHTRMLSGDGGGAEARELVRAIVKETSLAGVDRCREWLQAMPESYAAHWLCGAMWNSGAWDARGGKYAREVSAAQFVIMRERLLRARELLSTAAKLSPKPVQALTLLANNHFTAGDAKTGHWYLRRAEQAVPWYPALHSVRLNFALPEWGGSPEAVTKAYQRAREADVDEEELLYFLDHYVERPHRSPTPGAEKSYWERVSAERPTRRRLEAYGNYLWRLKQWHDVVAVADRLLRVDADRAEGYYMRAVAQEALGKHSTAVNDYRVAAALGHSHATEHLVRAHVHGHLGLPRGDWSRIDTLCRYGAALAVPAAATCVGSMFHAGGQPGSSLPNDLPQALAWHLLAARGGHYNAQHDFGWLAYTLGVPDLEPEQAKAIGVFWLRRAAEQGQEYAKLKLTQANLPLSEPIERRPIDWVGMLWAILKRLFWRG